nr:hypothetical protein [Ramlibacter albus]
MWWDMAPEMRREFEHWHSHEHFPERLALPGFRRASRWAATQGPGFFILYELVDAGALSSPEYLARLNDPTPWSRQLMPHHANMVRSQCVVLESRGGAVARHALTLRFTPPAGEEQATREKLRALIDELVAHPSIGGAHLLKHQPPAIAPTEEQRIRNNADSAADWIFIVLGWESASLAAIADAQVAGADAVAGLYQLSLSMAAGDPA